MREKRNIECVDRFLAYIDAGGRELILVTKTNTDYGFLKLKVIHTKSDITCFCLARFRTRSKADDSETLQVGVGQQDGTVQFYQLKVQDDSLSKLNYEFLSPEENFYPKDTKWHQNCCKLLVSKMGHTCSKVSVYNFPGGEKIFNINYNALLFYVNWLSNEELSVIVATEKSVNAITANKHSTGVSYRTIFRGYLNDRNIPLICMSTKPQDTASETLLAIKSLDVSGRIDIYRTSVCSEKVLHVDVKFLTQFKIFHQYGHYYLSVMNCNGNIFLYGLLIKEDSSSFPFSRTENKAGMQCKACLLERIDTSNVYAYSSISSNFFSGLVLLQDINHKMQLSFYTAFSSVAETTDIICISMKHNCRSFEKNNYVDSLAMYWRSYLGYKISPTANSLVFSKIFSKYIEHKERNHTPSMIQRTKYFGYRLKGIEEKFYRGFGPRTTNSLKVFRSIRDHWSYMELIMRDKFLPSVESETSKNSTLETKLTKILQEMERIRDLELNNRGPQTIGLKIGEYMSKKTCSRYRNYVLRLCGWSDGKSLNEEERIEILKKLVTKTKMILRIFHPKLKHGTESIETFLNVLQPFAHFVDYLETSEKLMSKVSSYQLEGFLRFAGRSLFAGHFPATIAIIEFLEEFYRRKTGGSIPKFVQDIIKTVSTIESLLNNCLVPLEVVEVHQITVKRIIKKLGENGKLLAGGLKFCIHLLFNSTLQTPIEHYQVLEHYFKDEDRIKTRELIAIAAHFLPIRLLSDFIQEKRNDSIDKGKIDGFFLVGFNEDGVEILDKFVSETQDFQTALFTILQMNVFTLETNKIKVVYDWCLRYKFFLMDIVKDNHCKVEFLESVRILEDHWSTLGRLKQKAFNNESLPINLLSRCPNCFEVRDFVENNVSLEFLYKNEHSMEEKCKVCSYVYPICSICLFPFNRFLPNQSQLYEKIREIKSLPQPDEDLLAQLRSLGEKIDCIGVESINTSCGHIIHANCKAKWVVDNLECPAWGCDCECSCGTQF